MIFSLSFSFEGSKRVDNKEKLGENKKTQNFFLWNYDSKFIRNKKHLFLLSAMNENVFAYSAYNGQKV